MGAHPSSVGFEKQDIGHGHVILRFADRKRELASAFDYPLKCALDTAYLFVTRAASDDYFLIAILAYFDAYFHKTASLPLLRFYFTTHTRFCKELFIKW